MGKLGSQPINALGLRRAEEARVGSDRELVQRILSVLYRGACPHQPGYVRAGTSTVIVRMMHGNPTRQTLTASLRHWIRAGLAVGAVQRQAATILPGERHDM